MSEKILIPELIDIIIEYIDFVNVSGFLIFLYENEYISKKYVLTFFYKHINEIDYDFLRKYLGYIYDDYKRLLTNYEFLCIVNSSNIMKNLKNQKVIIVSDQLRLFYICNDCEQKKFIRCSCKMSVL